MKVTLANGLVVEAPSFKGFTTKDITGEVEDLSVVEEDDLILITDEIKSKLLSEINRGLPQIPRDKFYLIDTFNNAFPGDWRAYPIIKKYLIKADLNYKEQDMLRKFVEKHEYHYDPRHLALDIENKLYRELPKEFNPLNKLFQLVCILTHRYGEEVPEENGLKHILYKSVPSQYTKDLKFYFESQNIPFEYNSDSSIKVCCNPFVDYVRLFFSSIFYNLPLASKKDVLEKVKEVFKENPIQLDIYSSEVLLRSTLDLYKISDIVLYRLRNRSEKPFSVYIDSYTEDSKRLYQDFLVTEKEELLIRVLKVEG